MYALVLPDHTPIALAHDLTIGRARGNALRIADSSVSRTHARISPGPRGSAPVLRDAGSTYGTFVDGLRVASAASLRDGSRIELGNLELTVMRQRTDEEAGRTIVVPAGSSVLITRSGAARTDPVAGANPRLRSGYALKRLEGGESTRRWVLRDLVGGETLRLGDEDAALLELLDGHRSVADLSRSAEERFGSEGPARLALLIADLSARDLLAGARAPRTNEHGILRVRRRTISSAASFYERLYRAGAWRLFTATGLAVVVLVIAAGLASFAYLIAARYGTPFVVAHKLALGGLVFVFGRLAIAALHESAHALTLASFGRRITEAGVKLVLIFPYLFVDTSEAWFEPRRRREAVSAAGPASDLTLGGAFSLICLLSPPGTTRDVFFQLAFGGYVAALFNLNPLLERDGYQILVDVLDEPRLRPRAIEQLRRRFAGERQSSDSATLARYGLLVLVWAVLTAAFAIVLSLRYEHVFATLVPNAAAWTLIAPVWIALLALPLMLVLPHRSRR
jgi:putative peptide zinc metalloprotease protein